MAEAAASATTTTTTTAAVEDLSSSYMRQREGRREKFYHYHYYSSCWCNTVVRLAGKISEHYSKGTILDYDVEGQDIQRRRRRRKTRLVGPRLSKEP